MSNCKPIKLFVTGLCLQGNKGGPALAISIRENLSKLIPLSAVTLSVPAGEGFKHEERIGEELGFEVVESIGPKAFVPPLCFLNGRFSRTRIWMSAFRKADYVIDMTAISYVGPPVGSTSAVFLGRFFYFLLALVFRKRFLPWTQSYGPLSTPTVRLLAKIDLQNQPVIFCRGDDCAKTVQELLPNKDVRSFPDVALTLTYDVSQGRSLLNSLLGRMPQNIISISPSAVLYLIAEGEGLENLHVKQIGQLCNQLIARGHFLVFVPHTLRLENASPERCDLEVCALVGALITDKSQYLLIKDDLGVQDLKSIISISELHIGARYHSVVAALSSGVPCISLSWHPKYLDLMRFYGMEKFVFGAVNGDHLEKLIILIEELLTRKEFLKSMIQERQFIAIKEVDQNCRLFVSCMEKGI